MKWSAMHLTTQNCLKGAKTMAYSIDKGLPLMTPTFVLDRDPDNPKPGAPINEKDLWYEYSTRGYMLYYKDRPIGGAGISKSAKGCRDNLKLFKEQAEMDKRAILKGYGQRYLEAIAEIQKEDIHNE